MESNKYTPCGGCGATEPDQRCIGCMHPFTEIKPDDLPVTPEWELINRIVSQWGNAVEMPNMEQWLKDYAAKGQPGAVWVKASILRIEYGKSYYAKWLDGNVKTTGWFRESDGTFFWNVPGYIPITKDEYEHLSILDESAAGREEDVSLFRGLKFRSCVAPINSYEVVELFEQSNEFKVKVTQECEVDRAISYEVWSIDGFEKYYKLGVYFKQQKEK